MIWLMKLVMGDMLGIVLWLLGSEGDQGVFPRQMSFTCSQRPSDTHEDEVVPFEAALSSQTEQGKYRNCSTEL